MDKAGYSAEIKSNETGYLPEGTYSYQPKEVQINSNNEKFKKWSFSNFEEYKIIENLNHSATTHNFDKFINGTYENIYPLTLNSTLLDLNTQGGTVYFKDPLEDNIFKSKTGGFVKTDAFKNLNIQIGTNPNQKYSVKYTNPMSYNGLIWVWLSGSLSPNTENELLLSQPVTFGATYKAQLASNTSNWVQSGMVNFNGKENVLYKSMNQLWLHLQSDASNREIKVAESTESSKEYSVVSDLQNTYVGYLNGSNIYTVKCYDITSGNLLWSSPLGYISTVLKAQPVLIIGTLAVPVNNCPPGAEECVTYTPYLGVVYQEGTVIKYNWRNLAPLGAWSVWWNSDLGTSIGTSSIKTATNGAYSYIYWVNGTGLYSKKYAAGFDNSVTVSNNSPSFASAIYYASGAVDGSGNLNLVYTQRRYYDHGVYFRKVNSNNTMNSESQLETYWSQSYMTSPYYYPQVLTSEGSNLLLEIGKPGYYYNPGYLFWKFNGSTWTKQSWTGTLFSVINPKKLLLGEADDYPKEIIVSGLNKFETAAATTNGVFNKINDGNRNSGSPYFSIVAQNLIDSNSFYIDLEPSSVDSIVVDTLNIWHIVLKTNSVSTELVTDLNLWGSASYTESNKTVVFNPDYETRYYYTIDPSSNSARMNKASSGEEAETNNSDEENSVSVYPNPFNPTTQIKIQIKEKSYVTISVYNLVGQQVMNEIRSGVQGELVVPFNGSNLSSGTYFYQVSINDKVFKGKLNLVK